MSHKRTTFWVAGFALAAQSTFPRGRLGSDLYARVLDVLEPDADWVRSQAIGSLRAVDARRALDGQLVGRELMATLDSADPDAQTHVIDLRPPSSAAGVPGIYDVYPRTWMAIAELLHRRGTNAHLVVLVQHLGERDDPTNRRFAEMIEDGRLTMVDVGGGVWSKRFVSSVGAALADAMSADSRTSADALESKLIRRLGYFPRTREDGTPAGYNRFWFDGRYCTVELRELLRERLRPWVSEEDPDDVVVVHSEDASGWLRAPLEQAVNDLSVDIRLLAVNDVASEPEGNFRTAVAVHAVFDTGRSLARIADAIEQRFPAAKLRCMCVVATDTSRPNRRIRYRLKDVPVEHLLEAEQRPVGAGAFAPDPAYYASEDGSERFLALTAGDWWELSAEAEFILERSPPEYRDQLRRVPDLLKLVDRNAAWIASKVDLAIEQLTDRSALDVSLALVADEEAASRLGDVLADTLGNEPIRVPREAINAWKKARRPDHKTIQRWRTEGREWLRILDEAPPANRAVVIIDEFAYGGDTLAHLASLLQELGYEVHLVLTLAAFSRSRFEKRLRGDFGERLFAFYTTEWDVPEVRQRIQQPRQA